MSLPNFLILGAAKGGTTSVYHYLRQHPQIFMSSMKEPHFFSLEGEQLTRRERRRGKHIVTNLEAYQRLFSGVMQESAVGEASTSYLSCPRAPERIANRLPGVKLLAILRQPADRAYSAYNMYRREGLEPARDFRAALTLDGRRTYNRWDKGRYLERGFYARALRRYYATFHTSQIRIFLHEDLKENPGWVISEICHFLGVENFYPDMSERLNVAGLYRNALIRFFLTRPNPVRATARRFLQKHRLILTREALRRKAGRIPPPPLPAQLRQDLTQSYRQDILTLQEMIHRDLSHWLK